MSTASRPFELAFVTDVEGNLDFFQRWVELSKVVSYDADGQLELAHSGAHFVFGGDVGDKGMGSIRLCRQLAAFKRRYPERVSLLVGNRDLNKLRLTAELGPADLARRPEEIPPPHWDRKAPSLAEYLAQDPAKVDSRAERLRYMLRHTLGCPDTFELHRREMALLRGVDAATIRDDEVVDDMVAGVGSPNHEVAAAGAAPDAARSADSGSSGSVGALREYLECACAAAVVGNTLFVHGAVDARNAGAVLSDSTPFCAPPLPEAPLAQSRLPVHEWAVSASGRSQEHASLCSSSKLASAAPPS